MICLKNLTAAPPRLQKYDMVIKYRPGKLADGLSRLPNRKNKEVIDLYVKVDFVHLSTEKLTQIRQATNADPILCELRVRILQGWPESRRELHKGLQPYWSYRDELPIENGILLKGDRILIPKSMETETLEKFIMVTKEATNASSVQKHVFWSGINSDRDKIVEQCAICQKLQKSQSAESHMQYQYVHGKSWLLIFSTSTQGNW